ncbi:MAG: PCRF domain-containing protein, partial [Pseudomonadales bacterium]
MLKQSIQHKLDLLCDRYEEVGALMSDPDVINNQDRFRELAREYAELEPVVKSFAVYRQALADIEGA